MIRNAIALFTSTLLAACAFEPPVYDDAISHDEGIAIGGYDTVAYHTDGTATLGDPAITATFEGATWQLDACAMLERWGGWTLEPMSGASSPLDAPAMSGARAGWTLEPCWWLRAG